MFSLHAAVSADRLELCGDSSIAELPTPKEFKVTSKVLCFMCGLLWLLVQLIALQVSYRLYGVERDTHCTAAKRGREERFLQGYSLKFQSLCISHSTGSD